MRNERLVRVDRENGAFKQVAIYETFVVKSAKAYENSYLTLSEAKLRQSFYDDEGNFRESWVDEYNYEAYNDGPDEYECQEEMQKEFNFVKTFSHLPIIVPILWGDENEFAMPRVKTHDQLATRGYNERQIDLYSDRVYNKVVALLNRSHLKVSKHYVKHTRCSNIITTGWLAGFSVEKTAKDLYYFLMLNETRNLTDDMHTGNLGIYRNHIVTFDTGRASDEPYYTRSNSRKKLARTGTRYSRHHSFNNSDEKHLELENLVLRAKYDKLAVTLTPVNEAHWNKVDEVFIKKIDKDYQGYLKITDKDDNVYYLRDYKVSLAV